VTDQSGRKLEDSTQLDTVRATVLREIDAFLGVKAA